MIKKAIFNLNLTIEELRDLVDIKEWKGEYWEKPPNKKIIKIKRKIIDQLKSVQKKCSYCGLNLGCTSNGEVDHIAPKNKKAHPEFTFTLKNLTLACHNCNFPGKKGSKETIANKSRIYQNCEFLLVHPYFDNPEDHYEWVNETHSILIQVKNNSKKGKFSIEMFKLYSSEMSEQRACEFIHDQQKELKPLTSKNEKKIFRALNYKEKDF